MKYSFFIYILFLNSCSSINSDNANSLHEKTDSILCEKDSNQNYIHYSDSTNFDNFSFKTLISKEEFKQYKLNSILNKVLFDENSKIELRKKIQISDNFESYIFTIEPNEHELKTILITYNQEMELIDYKIIASDEIAESCYQTTSQIKGNELIVMDYDYCTEENTQTKITKYRLSNKGVFQ